MDALLEFMWKSTGVLLLFVIVYQLLLRRLTFFNANRWFLIGGLLASISFPFIEITQTVYVEAPQEVYTSQEIATPMAFILEQQPIETSQIEPEPTIDLRLLAMYGYFAVVLFFLGKMTVELASLVKLIRSGAREKRGGFVFVSLSRKLTPFSFFNYICYSEQEKNHEELALIIDHEKVHARQWHSVDLLLSHLYRAFFWWNPLAWIAKKQIGENLEFIADAVAKRQHAQGHTYERALLSRAASHMQPALANNFFTPFIKQRIVMLQKEASATWNAYKYALILPVMLVFIYSFNRVQEIEYVDNENAPTKSKSELTVDELYKTFLNNEQEDGITSQNDSVDNKKHVHFQIITNTLDVDLKEYQEDVNANRPYQIKFENIKRDRFGRLESVIVACKFPDRPWNRDIKLFVEKGEINHFYIQETSFQIQRGATETDFFADSGGIQYMDRKKGETIKYDIYNKKKPVVVKFDTKEQVMAKLKVFLENDAKLTKMPLFLINEKIVDFNVFKAAYGEWKSNALATFYDSEEAVEIYGNQGINGAWLLYVVDIFSTGKKDLGSVYSLVIDSTSSKPFSFKTNTLTLFTGNDNAFFKHGDNLTTPTLRLSNYSSSINQENLTIKATMSREEVEKIVGRANKISSASLKLVTLKYKKDKIIKIKLRRQANGSKSEIVQESTGGIKNVCILATEKDITIKSCSETIVLQNMDGSGFVLPAMNDKKVDYTQYMNGKSQPVVVLDGKTIPYEKLDAVDADQIESVTVLKGNDATSLYGDKGKNGVILITTKKEEEGLTYLFPKKKSSVSTPIVTSKVVMTTLESNMSQEELSSAIKSINQRSLDEIILEKVTIKNKLITELEMSIQDGVTDPKKFAIKNEDGIAPVIITVTNGTLEIVPNGAIEIKTKEQTNEKQNEITAGNDAVRSNITFFKAQSELGAFFIENNIRYEFENDNSFTRKDEHGETVRYILKGDAMMKKRPGVATELINASKGKAYVVNATMTEAQLRGVINSFNKETTSDIQIRDVKYKDGKITDIALEASNAQGSGYSYTSNTTESKGIGTFIMCIVNGKLWTGSLKQ